MTCRYNDLAGVGGPAGAGNRAFDQGAAPGRMDREAPTGRREPDSPIAGRFTGRSNPSMTVACSAG